MKFTYLKINVLILCFTLLSLVSAGCKKREEPKTSILTLFSEKDFNNFFPHHSTFFTYAAFEKAVKEFSAIEVKIERRGTWMYKITRTDKVSGKSTIVRQDKDWDEDWAKKNVYTAVDVNYNDFCASTNMTLNKKEAAAFFANIAHETRNGEDNKFDDGLMLKDEVNKSLPYIIPNPIYPAVAGKKYYGRGPIQLSYNGNYGFASSCILGDQNILLKNPDQVSNDPVLAFKTAIYFWMTPQGLKPSAHAVMTGEWKPSAAEMKSGYRPGFGMTINIINGAIECNKGDEQANMKDRIGFYRHFLTLLGTADKNGECSCGKMSSFPN